MARRTFTQCLDRVAQNVGRHSVWIDPPASDIVATAARELTESFQWSYRKRLTLFQTIAPYATGTLAVTLGSAAVVGTGTAWTAAMVGRAIRISGEEQYFFVATVSDPTHLTLGDFSLDAIPWGAASNATATYSIFPTIYALPATLDIILFPTEDWKVYPATAELLDRMDPHRTSTGRPSRFALAQNRQVAGSEKIGVEFWPIPDRIYTMKMPFLVKALDPIQPTDIPLCPTELVEQLGTVKALGYLHIKTGDSRYLDQINTIWIPQFRDNYQECIKADQERYGLPQALSDEEMQIGSTEYGQRDWDML